jgi:hypothetical protein
LAKQTTTTPTKTASVNTPLIPRPTDPRAELFFLVGRIAGQGVEGAGRIAELVIELTAPVPQPQTPETES